MLSTFICAYAEEIKEKKKISLSEVALHNRKEVGVWVIYNQKVFDITNFIDNHPGGDKILLAAGQNVEPYWDLYAFHKKDDILDILEQYYIGELDEATET
ncbi:unnamed protein product [Protopolystoma xenopodis]|uniref:Cytochrome b5 heme-binding domain-containing protein n=1 Tax=Protopolystoma xenopodis TaxID=117903 RepID=A0A448X5Z6_9PLAT|nr:unnamed protein product [Protopolystoma xenopodis]